MARPELREPRVLAMFAGEVTDRTRALEDGLLALPELEGPKRDELLHALARDVHTLKGSAAMMGAEELVELCHALEDELGELRDRGGVEAGTVTRLLRRVDRLRTAGAAVTGVETDGHDEEGRVPVAGAPATERPAPAGTENVRLPIDKLDRLVSGMAELRVATSSLSSGAARDGRLRPLLRSLDRAVSTIDRAVRDTVTVPVLEACHGLARTVRDIAESQDKQVRLRLDVGDAEIDRRAIGVVRDALLHLVRNAVDHGIEVPTERRAAGKPDAAEVIVRAEVRGDRVAVTVRDDGRGIDPEAVREAAARAGLPEETDALELVFSPSLSTAEVATDISGRGVGLDAVRDRVESLGGAVTLRSEPGRGTEVTLVVPASLATARVLLVEVGNEAVALLTASVQRLVRVTADDVVVAEGRTWLRRADGLTPLVDLGELADLRDGEGQPAGTPRGRPAVLITTGGGATTAMMVDGVIGEQELLIQPIGAALARVPALIGAGQLASGRIVLLLHPAALVRSARLGDALLPAVGVSTTGQDGPRGRVLLVEDAPTTRALEQGLLEAAGFAVLAAGDGQEAWQLLRREEVDVVVSDVEMPRVDGLELCRRIRGSPVLQDLPVILVTSRGDEDDRRRGAAAGADAYLVKSSFSRGDLLAAIDRVLP